MKKSLTIIAIAASVFSASAMPVANAKSKTYTHTKSVKVSRRYFFVKNGQLYILKNHGKKVSFGKKYQVKGNISSTRKMTIKLRENKKSAYYYVVKNGHKGWINAKYLKSTQEIVEGQKKWHSNRLDLNATVVAYQKVDDLVPSKEPDYWQSHNFHHITFHLNGSNIKRYRFDEPTYKMSRMMAAFYKAKNKVGRKVKFVVSKYETPFFVSPDVDKGKSVLMPTRIIRNYVMTLRFNNGETIQYTNFEANKEKNNGNLDKQISGEKRQRGWIESKYLVQNADN